MTTIAHRQPLVFRESEATVPLPSSIVLATSIAVIAVFSTYLSGQLVQSVQALTMLVLLGFFIYVGRTYPDVRCSGWAWILLGLNLIAFGSIVSMFDSVMFGGRALSENGAFRQWLEQVVGIAVGFTLLAYRFYRWIPAFLESKSVIASYLERTIVTVESQREALKLAEEKARLAEEEARMAEDLRRLKEFNDLILRTMPSGLVVVDLRDRVLLSNSTFCQMVGRPDTKLAGWKLSDLIPSEGLAAALRRVADRSPCASVEVAFRPAGGTESRTAHVTLASRAEGVTVLVLEDVTVQRQAEIREKQLAVQILQSEKLSALGELVSGVAHELNNPLSIISGYAELLEAEDLPPETHSILGEVAAAAFRCKRIVGNLLTFARQHKPEQQYVDINQVLQDAVSLRDYQFRVDRIQLVKELSPLPATVADPYQLQQVFFNIINNGYHALKSWAGPRQLHLRTRVEAGVIRVEIQDTGPGMPAQVLNRIFDPFFTTKEVGEGTGLGLSITFGIVKEHGGTVGATSMEGEGACFRVDLPVRQHLVHSVPKEETKPALQKGRLTGKRILLVDDEESIADICRIGLEKAGCEVDVATCGDEALRRLAAAAYDLVISDMRMPGLSGPDIHAYLLKQNPRLAGRMLFMTGDTVGDETRDFLENSGHECLVKPFGLVELEKKVLERFDRPTALRVVAA